MKSTLSKLSLKVRPRTFKHLDSKETLDLTDEEDRTPLLKPKGKLIIDPYNVSSFYAVNPQILKMPILSLKSRPTLDNIEKPLNQWSIDQKWAKICQEVISPFPKNRTIIKHELKKDYHVKFEEEIIRQELPKSESMYEYFKMHQNSKRMKQIIDSNDFPLSELRDERKQTDARFKFKKLIKDAFLDLTERKKIIKKKFNMIPINERKRRKSCHCTCCGGISNLEKKLEARIWMNEKYISLDPEEEKQKDKISLKPLILEEKKKRFGSQANLVEKMFSSLLLKLIILQ